MYVFNPEVQLPEQMSQTISIYHFFYFKWSLPQMDNHKLGKYLITGFNRVLIHWFQQSIDVTEANKSPTRNDKEFPPRKL